MHKSEALQWLTVHTRPHQERKVCEILKQEQASRANIMEVYCPSHPIVRVQRGGHVEQQPLFAGKVFVLSTQADLSATLSERYPEGYLEYDKTQRRVMVIPEQQMLFFMDFNENYPEKVLVLERPYRDYAFNEKNDAPNEAVMVVDGPFAGKTGYFVKFRGQRRLVFQLQGVAISIPDIWDYHLKRLHNNDADRQTRGTLTARMADRIVDMLQDCGLQQKAPEMLSLLLTTLADRQSFAALITALPQHADGDTLRLLTDKIKALTPDEAADWLALANFTRSNPDFLPGYREAALVRPFLTPPL